MKREKADKKEKEYIVWDDEDPIELQNKPKRKKGPLIIFLIVLIIAGIGYVGYRFWRIEQVEISGKLVSPKGIVLQLSGVKIGQPVYTINKKKIEAKIENDPRFVVDEIEYQFPATLKIQVTEREECAMIHYLGQNIFIARDGMILRIDTEDQVSSAIVVRGLSASRFSSGQIVNVRDPYQLQVLLKVIDVLYTTGQKDWYGLIDVTNPVDIKLLTRNSQITVCVGRDKDLEVKFARAASVLTDLEKEKAENGVVDIKDGVHISYAPKKSSAPDDNQEISVDVGQEGVTQKPTSNFDIEQPIDETQPEVNETAGDEFEIPDEN